MKLIRYCDNTEEWKRQHGNVKTLYMPIILSYLMMKVFFFFFVI